MNIAGRSQREITPRLLRFELPLSLAHPHLDAWCAKFSTRDPTANNLALCCKEYGSSAIVDRSLDRRCLIGRTADLLCYLIAACPRWPDGANLHFLIKPDGACFEIGGLREIVPESPAVRPSFGNDEIELARLRQRFETWDFSWCT